LRGKVCQGRLGKRRKEMGAAQKDWGKLREDKGTGIQFP